MSASRVNPIAPAHTHVQDTPATTWTINHNLGRQPSVTIVSAGGQTVLTQINYTDDSSLTLTFNPAMAGTAYLN